MMSCPSIESTAQQHQRLEAVAALQGKPIKQYVLERVMPDSEHSSVEGELHALEAFLKARMEAAEREEFSARTPGQIFESALKNSE